MPDEMQGFCDVPVIKEKPRGYGCENDKKNKIKEKKVHSFVNLSLL
jgi:hypothetical protein